MVEHRRGDLFGSDIKVLAHGCNCAGAMGAGIALQFKRRFPAMYNDYRDACKTGVFQPGDIIVWEEDGYTIYNLGTEAHWKTRARLKWVRESVQNMIKDAQAAGITEIAMPRIGAGLGGLEWADVEEVLWELSPEPDFKLVVYSR